MEEHDRALRAERQRAVDRLAERLKDRPGRPAQGAARGAPEGRTTAGAGETEAEADADAEAEEVAGGGDGRLCVPRCLWGLLSGPAFAVPPPSSSSLSSSSATGAEGGSGSTTLTGEPFPSHSQYKFVYKVVAERVRALFGPAEAGNAKPAPAPAPAAAGREAPTNGHGAATAGSGRRGIDWGLSKPATQVERLLRWQQDVLL